MSALHVTSTTAGYMSPRPLPEDDPYPLIRSAVPPEYADLPPEDLEAVLARNGIRAEAMESFFGDVGNFFKKAAPVVGQVAGRALPGIVSGATTGAALGPWGALGGALIGGVTSALSGGGPSAASGRSGKGGGPLSAISSALPAIAGLAGGGGAGSAVSALTSARPAVAGLAGGKAGGASNPAGVLLGLLGRPELQQALMSMALGPAGAKTVPAGASGTPVPASGFANLLGALASKAFSQSEAEAESSESLPEYLYREGELAVDPALPEARAARLLEMLGETSFVEPPPPPPPRLYTEIDEYYDELDRAELDAMEMEGDSLELDE